MTTAIDLSGIQHRPCPKRGVLVFWNLPPELARREDSTQWADFENRPWSRHAYRDRPATDTEKLLLAHLGYTLPNDLTTRVQWLSDGVRRRWWEQIPQTMEGLD